MNNVFGILHRLSECSLVAKSTVVISSFALSFFSPIIPVILLCAVATLLDMYYGIKVAVKLKRKIESGLSWNGTIKKLRDMFVMLVMARGIEVYILGDLFGGMILVGTVAFIITVTELLSIIENMNTINPNGPWRVMGHLLKKKGSDLTGIDIKEFGNAKQDKTDTDKTV